MRKLTRALPGAYILVTLSPLVSIGLPTTGAAAADSAESKPAYEEIVVQGVRDTKLQDINVSATILSRDQIDKSPENSIEELLQRLPGVVMPLLPANELHPTGDPLELRGFGTTPGRTLIMVDGIPFNDPFFRYLDWQKVPKEGIERIEVIRGGGASTLWGDMAMAGVINIVTREPQPGEIRASIGYGSFNTFRADAAATVFSNDKLRIGINFSHDQTDGFNKVPSDQNSPIFGATSSQSNDGNAAAYFTPTDNQSYYLKLGAHYESEKGLQEVISSNSWGTYDATLGGKISLADGSKIEANGFVSQWHFATQNAKDLCYNQYAIAASASSHCPGNVASPAHASAYLGQIENAPYLGTGGSVIWRPEIGLPELTNVIVGVDGRLTILKDGVNVYSEATPIAPVLAKPFVVTRGQYQFQGVFAQGTYRLDAIPLDVTLGLREDFWQLTGGSIGGTGVSGQTYSHFDPNVSFKYHLTPELALRGAVYESFDAPGMSQAFRSFVSGTGLSLGNSGLSPETNLGGEAGVAYDNHTISVEANGFYNSLSKFITSGKLCNATAACGHIAIPSVFGAGSGYSSITKNFNAGDASIAGAEIIGRWRVSDSVSVNASWTRTIAQITNNTALAGVVGGIAAANAVLPTNTQLGGIPAWTALLTVEWEPIAGLHLTGTLDSFPGYWTGTAHNTSGRNSGATIVDLGGSYAFAEHFEVFVNLQNIGDRTFFTSAANYNASASTPSNIGTPFNVFSGIRASL